MWPIHVLVVFKVLYSGQYFNVAHVIKLMQYLAVTKVLCQFDEIYYAKVLSLVEYFYQHFQECVALYSPTERLF